MPEPARLLVILESLLLGGVALGLRSPHRELIKKRDLAGWVIGKEDNALGRLLLGCVNLGTLIDRQLIQELLDGF